MDHIWRHRAPLTVSIIVPIVSLCYIRKNIETNGALNRKEMAIFSLIHLVGGVINFAGQIIPGILSFISAAGAVYVDLWLTVQST